MQKALITAALAILLAASANGQEKYPPETKNAALRYWLAFAELQDSSVDKGVQDLLEKTLSGEIMWDEAKLGPILDKNEAAILIMQRATKLPECDWGLEYSNGPAASIAYAPRARILGRLNTLYGMRLASRGDASRAVDAWLAGIRFSQHLAHGGPLIFSLIGKSVLLPNLKALTRATQAGSLDTLLHNRVRSTILALPDSGFDWAEALRLEEAGLESAIDRIAAAPDQAKAYEVLAGSKPPNAFTLPTSAERQAFHRLMLQAEQAFRDPPQQSAGKLDALQEQVKHSSWFFQQTTPSFTKTNRARAEIADARRDLLQALASR